jgi:tungstate transport system permease protein
VDEPLAATIARSLALSIVSVAVAAPPGLALGAVLGLTTSRWRRAWTIAARVAMAFPTVVVGLIVYGLYTRHGPAGSLGLLYTPYAIVTGEVLLAAPLVTALSAAAVRSLDPRFLETARSLRLSRARTAWLAVREAREGVNAALCAAFARCVTELGVALMVGGNLIGVDLLHGTRTLTTAIATETSRGDFTRGVLLGVALVGVAAVVNLAGELVAHGRRNP